VFSVVLLGPRNHREHREEADKLTKRDHAAPVGAMADRRPWRAEDRGALRHAGAAKPKEARAGARQPEAVSSDAGERFGRRLALRQHRQRIWTSRRTVRACCEAMRAIWQ
jgi:hypothetical protein